MLSISGLEGIMIEGMISGSKGRGEDQCGRGFRTLKIALARGMGTGKHSSFLGDHDESLDV